MPAQGDENQPPVISNTTPLINLAGVGQLQLLAELYGLVTIPEQVHDEYKAGRKPWEPDLADLPWLRVVTAPHTDPVLPKALGAGEAAVLSLAISGRARAVLLDERLARRIAARFKLPVTGTFGVLLAAKQQGFIVAVRPLLDKMRRQGRRISEVLYQRLLQAAGEMSE